MLDQLKPVFASFERHKVRYLVIGGVAAVLHGVPRLTLDLDILIDPTEDNAARLLEALREAGFGTAFLVDPAGLLKQEITVFSDFERIDVQTRAPGISFEHAWRNRIHFDYGGQNLNLAHREDLIASKRAAGRPVDLEDVRLLEQAGA
ncbi:MAG: hypothetical protein NTW86_05180 [Candidatus Sumerlaeota bacterium]|nr:hypothetical protein [Candidatus Sumerlaeota bacterium]